MDKLTTDRERLYEVIKNSILWDACVLEAYEGDVNDLIENILFAGFTYKHNPTVAITSEFLNVCVWALACMKDEDTSLKEELKRVIAKAQKVANPTVAKERKV